MDKGPWALMLSESITDKNPVRLNPDKAIAPVLNKLTGKNLLSIGGIIQIYQFLGSDDDNLFSGTYLVGEEQRSY
ncbi:hypothetical protein N0824_03539 [Microcystis sp. 0824]|nr:hypothetical protein N0824_03539 [Microcystis sp. 0824]